MPPAPPRPRHVFSSRGSIAQWNSTRLSSFGRAASVISLRLDILSWILKAAFNCGWASRRWGGAQDAAALQASRLSEDSAPAQEMPFNAGAPFNGPASPNTEHVFTTPKTVRKATEPRSDLFHLGDRCEVFGYPNVWVPKAAQRMGDEVDRPSARRGRSATPTLAARDASPDYHTLVKVATTTTSFVAALAARRQKDEEERQKEEEEKRDAEIVRLQALLSSLNMQARADPTWEHKGVSNPAVCLSSSLQPPSHIPRLPAPPAFSLCVCARTETPPPRAL